MKKQVKKPCINCIYFKVCGDSSRTEACGGRMTKREQKSEGRKNEKDK